MSGGLAIVVGGGAAGFFAAITCAESAPGCRVVVFERGPHFLSKVRISGGGRCNVTHACFDPRELSARYPRGGPALIGPFHRFQPRDTVAWFESRGVALKTESDGRMFPVTDSSGTIVDCLLGAARQAGVEGRTGTGVLRLERKPAAGLEVLLDNGERWEADRVLLATGGCRSAAQGQLAVRLGHVLEPPVPSLFTFDVDAPWLRELAGVSVDPVELTVREAGLRERGPLLVTHRGISGPAVLRLSAWGARALHARDYRFVVRVNWLPSLPLEALPAALEARRREQGARRVVNGPLPPIPGRLWEQLMAAAGVRPTVQWAGLSRAERQQIIRQLGDTELAVTGKSLNQDEFVTCGGVRLAEVNFKTMESRLCPGLHFAGELLDIDALTGGYNFQAAWTTGWIAGQAMSEGLRSDR